MDGGHGTDRGVQGHEMDRERRKDRGTLGDRRPLTVTQLICAPRSRK